MRNIPAIKPAKNKGYRQRNLQFHLSLKALSQKGDGKP
jgi:hypothetical protein